MIKPARVLVSGYCGFGNAGDEAILAGLVDGFRKLAPEVELIVLSADPASTESEHGVSAAPRGLVSAYRWARRSDLLLSGGGGLLQDATSWRSPLYYLTVMRLARAAGIPVACVGQGVGPLRRWPARTLTRRVLSRADVLAVRDPLSEGALRQLGVGRQIEVTADLALALSAPAGDEVERAWRKAGISPDTQPAAAIALRSPVSGATAPELAGSLGEAIGGGCERLGLRPILVPFQQPRDVEFARRVIEAMPSEPQLVSSELSARELLALIAGCDLVVAMRLHALVFAAICGVPPVAVSYDPKVDALMEQLGLRAATATEDFDGEALVRGIADTWESRSETSARVRRRAEELRAGALRNVELALALLSEGK